MTHINWRRGGLNLANRILWSVPYFLPVEADPLQGWQKFKLPVERDQRLKPSAQDEIEKASLVIPNFLNKAPPI